MKRLSLALVVVFLFGLISSAKTITVGPDPNGYDFCTLDAAVEIAESGDEIVLAAGQYSTNLAIYKSLALRGEGKVELVPHKSTQSLIAVYRGIVFVANLHFLNSSCAIEVAGNVDLTVEDCIFDHCKAGVSLEDGRGTFLSCQFTASRTGIKTSVRTKIERCRFLGNKVGLQANSGGSVELRGCLFYENARAIHGDFPCQLNGDDNKFKENGIDLEGHVNPALRPVLLPARELKVIFPSPAYQSLQQAVDALIPGGQLIVKSGWQGSAVIDKSLNIVPLALGGAKILGRSTNGESLLPAFSIIGDVRVSIERLTIAGGIFVGPQASVTLSNVELDDVTLRLSGSSELVWNGGYGRRGKLILEREAVAQLQGIKLLEDFTLQVESLSCIHFLFCEIGNALEQTNKTVISVSGCAQVTIEDSSIWGAVVCRDRCHLILRDTTVSGGGSERTVGGDAAIYLGGPVNIQLERAAIAGSPGPGLYFAGNAHVLLDGVAIYDNRIGIAIENRCEEFFKVIGPYTSQVTPVIEIGPRGVSFQKNEESDFCPPYLKPLWPEEFLNSDGEEL